MRFPGICCVMGLVGCLFLLLGCPGKEEPPALTQPDQPRAPVVQQSATAPQDEKGTADPSTLYGDFTRDFSRTLSQGDTVEALRERMELADRARLSSIMLRSDVQDPAAQEFLVRFSDVLQRYLDLAPRHMATLEEIDRLQKFIDESKNAIAAMPDKDKGPAIARLNPVIEEHNALAEGALARERGEIKEITDELLGLK
jgi:hypothetical protein